MNDLISYVLTLIWQVQYRSNYRVCDVHLSHLPSAIQVEPELSAQLQAADPPVAL